MMVRFLHWLAEWLWLRVITTDGGETYLERYLLRGRLSSTYALTPRSPRWLVPTPERFLRRPWWSAYLHRFRLHDRDRSLHSHPWRWSFSLVLSGGYTEERLVRGEVITRRVRPGTLNWLGGGTFHRVTELHGEVWTIFICGRKASSWGFMVDGKFVPWRERLQQRGIPV